MDGPIVRVFDDRMADALHVMSNEPYPSAGPGVRERRRSARIPLAKPVRLGPPRGIPQALVSAADLSVGGLFIDADRKVREGARFSVEVQLSDGALVYVEEAEVVYNRVSPNTSGFGVKFVRIDPATEHAIAQDIRRLSPEPPVHSLPPAVRSVPAARTASAAPSAVRPEPPAVRSVRPAPEFSEIDQDSVPTEIPVWSSRPSRRPRPELSLVPPMEDDLDDDERSITSWRPSSAPRSSSSWFGRNARGIGLFLISAAAVTVVIATVSFLWSIPDDDRFLDPTEPVGPTRVPSDTHNALMADETPAAEVMPPPPRPTPKKRVSLPDRVRVEFVEAKPLRPPRGVGRPEGDVFRFKLSQPATVRFQGVYPKTREHPERLVIDLVGGRIKMEKPLAKGGIRGFRVGYHPGFTRLVLDAKAKIKNPKVKLQGRQLLVTVEYD